MKLPIYVLKVVKNILELNSNLINRGTNKEKDCGSWAKEVKLL